MRIKKVSIDGELDTFGGRALIVQTDTESFKTPQRVLTSTEINYKAKLPSEPPINNELSEVVSQFSTDQWSSFMEKNGAFASRLATLKSFDDKMAYTWKRFFPQIPQAITLDDSAGKLILELQRMSELDFITLPYIQTTIVRFPKMVSDFAEDVVSEKREPLVYLDMGLEPADFEERYEILLGMAETGLINTIGLVYKPIQQVSRNYRTLWERREAPVLLQMSDIPRNIKSTSTMHLLQKWGIDTFSVRMSRFGGGSGAKKVEKAQMFPKIKRFDPVPLEFKPFEIWSKGDHPLSCKCHICRNMTASEFIETYTGEYEDYPGQTFNAAMKLHEYYKSSDEFAKGRKHIREGTLSEYFREKAGLQNSDTPVPKKIHTIEGFK